MYWVGKDYKLIRCGLRLQPTMREHRILRLGRRSVLI
jgi:hypothetical protein